MNAPRLISVATALPPHEVRQDDAKRLASHLFEGMPPDDRRLIAVFDTAGIETRQVVRPLEWYEVPRRFGETNRVFIESALELAEAAATRALDQAGLSPDRIDHLMLVTSTGVATPSLDARLANRMAFRPDIRRVPLWGLGCAGGAAGVARALDLARGAPRGYVLLISLEICSLTFQHGDVTRQNLVACSLFGDGCAAAVIAGSDAPAPARVPHRALELIDARSTLWQDTLDVMGWNIDEDGLHVVFSRDIPTIVREWALPSVESFLASHGLDPKTIEHVVTHPGGPKVLAAYAEALDRPVDDFRHAHAVLREHGNMSSPTCLFVLERFVAGDEIGAGENALLAALGPGFVSETVLMRGAGA